MDNPNNYPLRFSDVSLDLMDFRNTYVGTAVHEDDIIIPAKKSKVFLLEAAIHTTEDEVKAIGDNCGLHADKTE